MCTWELGKRTTFKSYFFVLWLLSEKMLICKLLKNLVTYCCITCHPKCSGVEKFHHLTILLASSSVIWAGVSRVVPLVLLCSACRLSAGWAQPGRWNGWVSPLYLVSGLLPIWPVHKFSPTKELEFLHSSSGLQEQEGTLLGLLKS